MAVLMYDQSFNVDYDQHFYSIDEADTLLKELLELPFYPLNLKIGGKEYTPSRKVYAFADPGITYGYSGVEIFGEPWSATLAAVKQDVEKKVGCRFNFVLLNYYPDGNSKISAHHDNESSIMPSSCIPAISLGSKRSIKFKRAGYDARILSVDHGSLYIMHPPTNEYYTHEIPVEADITSPRISLTFRNITPTEQPPPLKKFKSDDGGNSLPCGDWLEKHYQSLDPKDPVTGQWGLMGDVVLRVKSALGVVRIDIREFNVDKKGRRFPTRCGVQMLPATWAQFQRQIRRFNFAYSDISFISNNQLAVLIQDERCVLQQIFTNNDDGFFLKPKCVKLGKYQVEKLIEHSDAITKCIQESLLCSALPDIIAFRNLQCSQSMHISLEESRLALLRCVKREVDAVINKLYKCNGCEIGHPSQKQHPCLTVSNAEKFMENAYVAYLHINIHEIANSLQTQCSCAYNEAFFKTLYVDEYYKYVENAYNAEKEEMYNYLYM